MNIDAVLFRLPQSLQDGGGGGGGLSRYQVIRFIFKRFPVNLIKNKQNKTKTNQPNKQKVPDTVLQMQLGEQPALFVFHNAPSVLTECGLMRMPSGDVSDLMAFFQSRRNKH